MLSTEDCSYASSYLGYGHDNMVIARHVEPEQRDFWLRQTIEDMRIAAALLGFDLVPRAAEKLEAAE